MTANSRKWVQPTNEKLWEVDPFTGRRTYFSSFSDGTWQFRHEFPSAAPSLDYSKALQNDDDHWKNGVKKGMAHYAHIPDSILFKWHCEGVNIRDTKALLKKVNSPEYSYLKCTSKIHT